MKAIPLACPGLLLLAAACAGPSEPDAALPAPRVSASIFVSGGEGVLRGTHLDRAAAPLVLDGVVVVPSTHTPSEIRFPMPPGRACETDGRPVHVRGGALDHTGTLSVPGALTLRPGESRVLDPARLDGLCLVLPAGGQEYVLTALNASLEPAPLPDPLLSLRTWTGAGGSPGGPVRLPATAPAGARPELARRGATLPAWEHRYSPAPVPFEARHASAAAGDTLPWIDWWGSRLPDCAGPRESLPTLRIVVAAVSRSGRTVIAYDARTAHASAWESAAVRARLERAAEMMDCWAVPAVREVMDPGYLPLQGTGGRWFHVFRADVPGWSTDGNDAPQTACRFSPEVTSTVGPDLPPSSDAEVPYLAGLAIHEYGHHAEGVYRIRRWGRPVPPGRTGTGWAGLGEVWAQSIQETAARLASGQPTAARYAALEAPGAEVPFADFYLNGHGAWPEQSLWGVTPGRRGGYYDGGTRFVMHLRERWGDATLGAPGARFFAAAQALPVPDVPSLAALVGLGPAEALDRWSLAEATDNLAAPGVAEAAGLPQIRTWVPREERPLPGVVASRSADASWRLRAGRGNFAALYVLAEGADARRGVSLSFGEVGSGPVVVRITRLR